MNPESKLWGFLLPPIFALFFSAAVLLFTQGVIGCSERQTSAKALMEAVERGTVEHVDRLIKGGVDINQLGERGTSLHIACYRGDPAMVRLLLANGADVRKRSSKGYEPLHAAVYAGNTVLARLLIEEYGVDVHARSNKGLEPLHNAAYNGHWQVAELLISKGADINATRNNGDTPLHAAVHKDRHNVTQRLIKAGADIKARNKEGCTPLYKAVKRRHITVAQLLLEAGADPTAACNDGSTPLQQASDKESKSGWQQMESLLTRYSVPMQ